MTIEGLGKKFQEARLARNMTLDEAARITKIRPSRLAEIEADDFSQFPSLAYAKGFLLIYGKSLDVDVTPYMEAFETSEHVTVDGYSYLQDNPAPKPARTPIVRHRSSSSSERTSLKPLVIGIIVLAVGFFLMKFILDIQRIAPRRSEQPQVTQSSPSATAAVASSVIAPPPQTVETPVKQVVAAASVAPALPPPPTAPPVAVAPVPPLPAASEPEVRRAEPVRPEDLAKAGAAESAGPNRVAIRPLKKTYIKVVVDNEAVKPAFERWISPADGSVEFRGQKIAVRVLDRDAVQIKKNGKLVADDDSDVTIE
jgi:cytoskeletal protein RodZ